MLWRHVVAQSQQVLSESLITLEPEAKDGIQRGDDAALGAGFTAKFLAAPFESCDTFVENAIRQSRICFPPLDKRQDAMVIDVGIATLRHTLQSRTQACYGSGDDIQIFGDSYRIA